jgi:hypothetical protein
MVTCHKGQPTSLSHAAPSISGNQCCPATFRNRAIFSSAFSSLDRFNSVIPHYPATQPQSAQMQKVAATSTSVTHDLIFNPKGKKMVPFFHVMISYRVSTEKHLARQMFDRLLLNSFKRIPTAGMSQWPDGFENQRPGHANIFLDQVCLKSGEDWKHSKEGGGFVNAVLKSLIFVPLLSWKVEVEPEKKEDPKVELENKEVHVSKSKMRFKGSVGDMVAKYSKQSLDSFIDPSPVERPFHDTVDNVLLELILAMELHEHLNRIHKGASCMYPCLRLFPIIIDNFPDFSQLPDKISELTYADAAKYLGPNGIHIKDKKTVREIVSFFFGVQAVTFSDFGKEDFALDTVCSKIISAVSDSVAKIDPLSLFESKPLCKELDAFLSKRNCSYMTSILAANNITSLRQLSFLTHQQAIYDLAKQCSSVSSKSAVAELTTLSSLIDESKHDEGSWLLSTRLDRFVDRDASFETVIKSSSGLIISAAQKSWLTMYFIVGAAFLVLGIMSVLSIGPGGNTILDFVGCAFLFSVCLAAVFHSPKRAYTVYCCMWPAWAVSIVIGFFIDFTENGSFSLDNASRCLNVGSQLQTSFRSCAIAQIMCGPLLLLCMMLLMLYQSLRRQDLAWNTALLCLIFYLVTEVAFELRVLGFSYSDSGPVTNYVIVSFLACIIALTESMNGLARRRARKSVAKDEKMYQDRWKALLKTKDEEFQLKQLTKNHLDPMSQDLEKFLLSSGSVQLLQDCKDIDVLYARAEFINEAFQSLVSILLESSPSAVEAKLTSEEKAAVEAHASSEAKPTSDSGVDHHGCANISAMKKELKAFFADDDVEEILKNLSHYEEIFKHLKPHNGVETSCQHAKEGDMSVKTIVQQQQQQQQQHLPGYIEQDDQPVKTAHDVETRVDMKRDSVEHGAQDHNKTINQDTQKGDGSVKSTEHSSGAKPDLARNHKVDDKATDIVTAHTVVVRRGPVKLPARAIAKVVNPSPAFPVVDSNTADVFMLHE